MAQATTPPGPQDSNADERRTARLDRLAATATLTVSQAAELCGVHRNTMAGWISGGLPVLVTPGGAVRISTGALLSWIEANTRPLGDERVPA